MTLPPETAEKTLDLRNWIHALKLHEYRPTTVSKRMARTLRDKRSFNGLGELGAYRHIGGKIFICLPIYDWWFLNAEQTEDLPGKRK